MLEENSNDSEKNFINNFRDLIALSDDFFALLNNDFKQNFHNCLSEVFDASSEKQITENIDNYKKSEADLFAHWKINHPEDGKAGRPPLFFKYRNNLIFSIFRGEQDPLPKFQSLFVFLLFFLNFAFFYETIDFTVFSINENGNETQIIRKRSYCFALMNILLENICNNSESNDQPFFSAENLEKLITYHLDPYRAFYGVYCLAKKFNFNFDVIDTSLFYFFKKNSNFNNVFYSLELSIKDKELGDLEIDPVFLNHLLFLYAKTHNFHLSSFVSFCFVSGEPEVLGELKRLSNDSSKTIITFSLIKEMFDYIKKTRASSSTNIVCRLILEALEIYIEISEKYKKITKALAKKEGESNEEECCELQEKQETDLSQRATQATMSNDAFWDNWASLFPVRVIEKKKEKGNSLVLES